MRRKWRQIGYMALVCACALAWLKVPAHAEVVQPRAVETGFVIVTAAATEVREGPSGRSDVITVVEKGEVFAKLGRTGGWYCLRINDDMIGWVSGRALRRYQPETAGSTKIGPSIAPYRPEYPADTYLSFSGPYYYGYPYYSWGEPYFYQEWYFYDREPYRHETWYRDRDRRGSDHDRHRNDDWHSSRERPLGDSSAPGDSWERRDDDRQEYERRRRSGSQSHPVAPRLPAPFRRR